METQSLRKLATLALSFGMVLLLAAPAHAGRALGGTVDSIAIVPGATPRAYVWLNVTSSSGSSSQCTPTAGWGNGMAFNINSDKGKALLSAITAAYLSGLPIGINETDDACLDVDGPDMYALDRLQY